MKLFSKKKEDDKQKEAVKSVKVGDAKKSSMKELYNGDKKVSESSVGDSDKARKTSANSADKEKKYGNAYRILVKPLVTEKATDLGSQNKYIFAVTAQANKIEITKAINEVYGIKPVAVNIIKMKGKRIRYGRISGRTKNWKKAIVTLPEGKSIKIYEGV